MVYVSKHLLLRVIDFHFFAGEKTALAGPLLRWQANSK